MAFQCASLPLHLAKNTSGSHSICVEDGGPSCLRRGLSPCSVRINYPLLGLSTDLLSVDRRLRVGLELKMAWTRPPTTTGLLSHSWPSLTALMRKQSYPPSAHQISDADEGLPRNFHTSHSAGGVLQMLLLHLPLEFRVRGRWTPVNFSIALPKSHGAPYRKR